MSKIILSSDQIKHMRSRELVEHGKVVVNAQARQKIKDLTELNEMLRLRLNKLTDIQRLTCLLDPDNLTLDKTLDILHQKYCILLRKYQVLTLRFEQEISKHEMKLTQTVSFYEARITELESHIKCLTQKIESLYLVEIKQRESRLEFAYRATLLDKLVESAEISLTGDFSVDFAALQSKFSGTSKQL